MIERAIAEKNRIWEIVTGSHLYGTATPESDKDFLGIFMPEPQYVLGFKRCEEVDFSVISKDVNGKNTKETLDRKLYEIRKFVSLARDNNPNILESLFVNEENIVYISDIGKELLAIRHLFPHKGLKQKFLGYAMAQKHKMVVKRDHYFDLVGAFDFLDRFDIRKTLLEVILLNNNPYFIKPIKSHKGNIESVSIGDVSFNPTVTIKFTRKRLEERISKVGNRKDLLLKYGMDVKFGSHLIRLMFQGLELLKTGELKFPLKERQIINDIKSGKWTLEQILNVSNELEKEIEDVVLHSPLPDKPNTEALENFVVNKLRDWILR